MARSTAALLLLCLCMATTVNAFTTTTTNTRYDDTGLAAIATPKKSVSATGKSDLPRKNSNNNAITNVEFPPPLSKVDRLKRAATFWSTALPIVASYYGLISNIKLQELLLGKQFTPEQLQQLWDAQHADGAAKLYDTISELQGFYVKTSQIISSRRDLFPEQYTDALSGFTDNVSPMPTAVAKAVVVNELLHADETFEDMFVEFDDEPLGAASVAQVHRAVLSEKYGGREVAVKIQRPSIESKLLGDVANLKALAKTFRDNPNLPLDYYTVFVELEKQLADEFDFVAEAVAMDRIYTSLQRGPHDNVPRSIPLVLPRPVAGLVSRRVLVMDYLRGVPLSRAREEMMKKGIDPDGPEAKIFGKKLLSALTTVFGRNILETGFFHADPHPGNIFVLEDGRIGLIDFGQVKQISGRNRETLCKIMIALDERQSDDNPADLDKIGKLAIELGVELNSNAQEEAAAAVGMWLFDGTVQQLPGGYDSGELSPNSPVRELKSFPQDLVLVGRSSILIKGLSNRLGIPWSLAGEWAPIARSVLNPPAVASTSSSSTVRFRDVIKTFSLWTKDRAGSIGRRLPLPVRRRVASAIVKVDDWKTRRKLTKDTKR